jgi:hypothetical protein
MEKAGNANANKHTKVNTRKECIPTLQTFIGEQLQPTQRIAGILGWLPQVFKEKSHVERNRKYTTLVE